MTKAKQTADQYNTLRSDMKSKISALQEEKRKTEQQVKKAMSFKGPEEAKKHGKEARTFLTKKFREENADLIAEYKKFGAEHRKNEAQFQKLFAEAKQTLNEDLTEEDFRELIMGKSEKKESKEITKEHLLNKPNMTEKDKEGMQKSIDCLIKNKMDTPENFKKLDAIVYTAEYIEIGDVKRTRKDITAKPDKKKGIFQHNNVTYFKRSEDMIEEQNQLLAQQGMEIPSESAYETSMKALPGEYSKTDRHAGGNILALITDMSMSGFCYSDGGLDTKGTYGYRWSASPYGTSDARRFGFGKDGGKLFGRHRDRALLIRPVFK